MAIQHLPAGERITERDSWLAPYRGKLLKRLAYNMTFERRILGTQSVTDFARGHEYFGLHATGSGWVLREWAPHATSIYLHCDASGWRDDELYKFASLGDGKWELKVAADALEHLAHYKLYMHWPGGGDYRVPAWATYVVQDPETHLFDAVVWQPTHGYEWHDAKFVPRPEKPIIYEAHVGMSSEFGRVSTYREFAHDILPRIRRAGYNTVQLMAVAEHPYYGSFGYHVSSFFAPSSRFGTPDDLRFLVDKAHSMGLSVIMDIVHSHAVKNEVEGLGRYDGSYDQFFHPGGRGNHEQWDSRVFDYGKPQVAHFLLSNCRYWLDEFHIDGYRFDGVTSMLYTHHGLGHAFDSYDKYFEAVDVDAVAYLTMANQLIHAVNPHAATIAEDMSAMPGLAAPIRDGGVGFDYRLSMGTPDLWIKYTKDKKDEDWSMSELLRELSSHRAEERTISYSESHDQALVGDKTLIFRLADKEMYDHMQVSDSTVVVDRAVALHKMIRLLTASLNQGGYLTFMGNEFGHPEWIDFPREGNGWSYTYARRQWSLVDNKLLKYHQLGEFDKVVAQAAAEVDGDVAYVTEHDSDKVLAFMRGDYLYVFNFSGDMSYEGYDINARNGDYKLVVSSDETRFGGYDRLSKKAEYRASGKHLKLYLPARTAAVYRHVK